LGRGFFFHNNMHVSGSSRTHMRWKAIAVRIELETFSRHRSSPLEILRISSGDDQLIFFESNCSSSSVSKFAWSVGKAYPMCDFFIICRMMFWLETRSEPTSTWNSFETTLLFIKKTRWTGDWRSKFSLRTTESIAWNLNKFMYTELVELWLLNSPLFSITNKSLLGTFCLVW